MCGSSRWCGVIQTRIEEEEEAKELPLDEEQGVSVRCGKCDCFLANRIPPGFGLCVSPVCLCWSGACAFGHVYVDCAIMR